MSETRFNVAKETVDYHGINYEALIVTFNNGTRCMYAEDTLSAAIEKMGEFGCDVDNDICYYPTSQEIKEMADITNQEEFTKYCDENCIWFADEDIVDYVVE